MLRISCLDEVGSGGVLPLILNFGSNKDELPDLRTLRSGKKDWPPSSCGRLVEVNISPMTTDELRFLG